MAEPDLDAATLRRMYIDEAMTIAAIARALRVRKQRVCAALAQWAIPRRRRGPRRRFAELPFTPGELRRLVRRKGIRAVARSLGVTPDVIYASLHREPLPRGTKRTVDDAAIWAATRQGCRSQTSARSFNVHAIRSSAVCAAPSCAQRPSGTNRGASVADGNASTPIGSRYARSPPVSPRCLLRPV